MQGTKARALAVSRKSIQQVAGQPGQPVEARHHQHVALASWSSARRNWARFATFGAKLLELSVERLPIGADAGVSVMKLAKPVTKESPPRPEVRLCPEPNYRIITVSLAGNLARSEVRPATTPVIEKAA